MSAFQMHFSSSELLMSHPIKCLNIGDSDFISRSSQINKSQKPMVTGASVLGIKCTDSVIIVSDILGSYGSMARFRNIPRIIPVG